MRRAPASVRLIAAASAAALLTIPVPSVAQGAAETVAGVESADVGAEAQRVRLKRIGNFAAPVHLAAPPTDKRRVFVVEKGGRIKVVKRGRVLRRPFLNLSRKVGQANEQGLLSMAFSPNYQRNRKFYVNYVNRSGDTRVVEYRRTRRNPNRAAPRSARTILRVRQPASNHNGGQLQFGPDGLLYIGMGDGGGGGDPFNNGQNLSTLHGSLLRIDPRPRGRRAYRIPRGNPFRARAGARKAIYAYGLRNPWRFSFDRRSGSLTIADVGQSAWEEINHRRRGRARGVNFGWRPFEGPARYTAGSAPGHVPPVLAKSHNNGWCSITGGYVVRDRRLESLYGKYLYGDFCQDGIRSVKLRQGGARRDRATGLSVSGLVSFGEDARGRIYTVSIQGPVSRIVPR